MCDVWNWSVHVVPVMEYKLVQFINISASSHKDPIVVIAEIIQRRKVVVVVVVIV